MIRRHLRLTCSAACILLLAAASAGCGGDDDEPVPGGAPGLGAPRGDASAGREVFTQEASPACGSCHTLEDAGTDGRAAPNLDQLQPGFEQIERAVRQGPGSMPSYEDRLSDTQIENVAAYVFEATRPAPP
jgi:cytochrome c6